MSSNMPDERTEANESGHGNFFPRQGRKIMFFPLHPPQYTSHNVVYKQLTLGFIRPRSLVYGKGREGEEGAKMALLEEKGGALLSCVVPRRRRLGGWEEGRGRGEDVGRNLNWRLDFSSLREKGQKGGGRRRGNSLRQSLFLQQH